MPGKRRAEYSHGCVLKDAIHAVFDGVIAVLETLSIEGQLQVREGTYERGSLF
jgi:hypothetical protein